MRYIPLLIALASPAWAQGPNCLPATTALGTLYAANGETVRVQGLTSGGNVLLITAGPSGVWTLLVVHPDGMACSLGNGEAFAAHDAEAQGEDS